MTAKLKQHFKGEKGIHENQHRSSALTPESEKVIQERLFKGNRQKFLFSHKKNPETLHTCHARLKLDRTLELRLRVSEF